MTTTKLPRTDAYRFTIQSLDDPRLAALRAEVKEENRHVPKDAARLYRVSVKGRTGPRSSHPLGNSISDREWGRMHTFGTVPNHLATYWDVYVHQYTRDTTDDRKARARWRADFEARQVDYQAAQAREREELRKIRLSYLSECSTEEIVAELAKRFPR